MEALALNPTSTALVLIDLQKGIVIRPMTPHAATDVISNARRLLDTFRSHGALVVLVRVSFDKKGHGMLKPNADEPGPAISSFPDGWDTLIPEVGPMDSDLVITKRQWGAFYGTELDLQLRRSGIKTIVLGGVSTNIGVESTARDAFERGYDIVFAEDAMATGMGADAHHFATQKIFVRLGRVRSTENVVNGFSGPARL